MAHEIDSESFGRLQAHYREMSDRELFDLGARPQDLTEMAREALRSELACRRLDLPIEEPPPHSSEGHEYAPEYESGQTLRGESVVLNTFHNAMEAGEACDALETAGIAIEVRDVAEKSAETGTLYGGPPVALQVIVSRRDRDRAVKTLREKMRLFPEQEVEQAEPAIDDGTVATLGDFGRREDAEAIARILDDAHIWHRVVSNPDGTVENEDAYTLQVSEIDLVKAGDVVEKALGLPE